MKKKNDLFEGAFDSLRDQTLPTDEQKERMLNRVLMESRLQDATVWERAGKWIVVYPWRFAFSAASVQAVVFALIFGTEYTNLFLKVFGG